MHRGERDFEQASVDFFGGGELRPLRQRRRRTRKRISRRVRDGTVWMFGGGVRGCYNQP